MELEDYVDYFSDLHRKLTNGVRAPHKPLLLLAIIHLYEKGTIYDNTIVLDGTLSSVYNQLWNKIATTLPRVRFIYSPDLVFALWMMHKELFWHIIPTEEKRNTIDAFKKNVKTPSYSDYQSYVDHAELDSDLDFLLTLDFARERLKEVILKTYLGMTLDSYRDIESSIQINGTEELNLSNHSESVDNKSSISLGDDEKIELEIQYLRFLQQNKKSRTLINETFNNFEGIYSYVIAPTTIESLQKEAISILSDLLSFILSNANKLFISYSFEKKMKFASEECKRIISKKEEQPKSFCDLYTSYNEKKETEVKPNNESEIKDEKIENKYDCDNIEFDEHINVVIEGQSDGYVDKERQTLVLEALSHFSEPATVAQIAMQISSWKWGENVRQETVDSILKSLTEVDYIKWGKYILKSRNDNFWNQNEENLLIRCLEEGKSHDDIAKIIGKTLEQVKTKISQLQLDIKPVNQVRYVSYEKKTSPRTSSVKETSPRTSSVKEISKYDESKYTKTIVQGKGDIIEIKGKKIYVELKNNGFYVNSLTRFDKKWSKGPRLISATMATPLFKALAPHFSTSDIEDFVYSWLQDKIRIKIKGVWYDNFGGIIKESAHSQKDETTRESKFTREQIINKYFDEQSFNYQPESKLKYLKDITRDTYDYLWILAIIEFANINESSVITFDEVACMMIASSWEFFFMYPDAKKKESELSECYDFLVEELKKSMGIKLDVNTSKNDIYTTIKDYPMSGVFEDTVKSLIERAPYNVLKVWFDTVDHTTIIQKSSSFEENCAYSLTIKKLDSFITINPVAKSKMKENHDSLIHYFHIQYKKFVDEN